MFPCNAENFKVILFIDIFIVMNNNSLSSLFIPLPKTTVETGTHCICDVKTFSYGAK